MGQAHTKERPVRQQRLSWPEGKESCSLRRCKDWQTTRMHRQLPAANQSQTTRVQGPTEQKGAASFLDLPDIRLPVLQNKRRAQGLGFGLEFGLGPKVKKC